MGLIPNKGEYFLVREAAWWGGDVLDHYPGREEAMRLAGHDWDVVEVPSFSAIPLEQCQALGLTPNKPNGLLRRDDGWKSHIRSDNGALLHKSRESFAGIPNSVAYEVAEALIEQGFRYETGISMDGGRQNALTLLLDEPIVISGDNSATLPYVGESWCHDGTGALKVRATSVRQVCQNTVSASEAEGKRLGTDFTFKHTKNWREKVEDAKKAIQGVREQQSVYVEAMEALAGIQVSPGQRDLFVSTILGAVELVEERENGSNRIEVVDKTSGALTTALVKKNIEAERAKILPLFLGATIPEAHALTGYGLHLAGVEYFDHLRAYRSKDSYVKRTLLSDNPAKANLADTIRKIALVTA